MKTVQVIFENPIYNYATSVNPKTTDEENRKYFVNTVFDMGIFPQENPQKCIRIKITAKKSQQTFLNKQTKIQRAIERVQKKLKYFADQSNMMFERATNESQKDEARALIHNWKWNDHHDLEYRLEKRLEDNWSAFNDWHWETYQWNAY
jgi:hypothetical protein